MFTSLLAVACVCILVALVLYFFYWNRFVAFIIRQSIRILYWKQEAASIRVDIGSIHFSLLAGRILFKDLRYHSSNQTVSVVKGQIQWRYWIRRPTTEDEIGSSRSGEEVKHSSRLSCRIQVSLQGVEWSIYNRTAAYDNILAQMKKATPSRPSSHINSQQRFSSKPTRGVDTTSAFYPPSIARKSILRLPSILRRCLDWFKRQLPNLDPKELLPLGIDVQTGVIVVGNPSVSNLLVAEFQSAVGTYGIIQSRSKYDLYRQNLNVRFQNVLVQLVNNKDYVDPSTTIGGLVHSRIKASSVAQRPSIYQSYRSFIGIWRHSGLYRLTTEYFATRRSQRQAQNSHIKLSSRLKKEKITDEDTPSNSDFSKHEYAIERKVLEAPALELTYYIDVPGNVPEDPPIQHPRLGSVSDIGNGGHAPEWGFDIIIVNGFLRYGPWTDRQRAEIQRVFFPPTYQDIEESAALRPGDKRTWTALQVFIELRGETVLSVPFREPSKDWQWDGVTELPSRPRRRDSAFMNVNIGDKSSITYVMPMVSSSSGYESTVEVHLDTISFTSSLNDIRLVSAESFRVRGELPAPLRWNGERTWAISLYLRQPILYLLRDHINMFTDLARDWVSGGPTDYDKFIPMIYTFQVEMYHFEVNLYANDQNIIDKPLVRDENALLTLRGPHLKCLTTIPSKTYRPESTTVSLNISIPDIRGSLSPPRWSTHALQAPKMGIDIFKAKALNIEGSYLFWASVQNDFVDQLHLDFHLGEPLYRAFGWSIRYFMVLRDNYLGSFTHFQTLSEYLNKRKLNQPIGDPLKLKYRPEKSNMLEVSILLRAERPLVLLPLGLIGSVGFNFDNCQPLDRCVALATPEIQMQFRMHDFFMEVSLNMDKIGATIHHESIGHDVSDNFRTSETLVVDGIDIVANRLFGPQPRTATYICTWEISVGAVRGSMNANEAKIFLAAANAFKHNFVDVINAPADDFNPPVDPDVTFYKISVRTIDLTWAAGRAALLVQLPLGLKLDSNDLGAHRYRKVTSLEIPQMHLRALLSKALEGRVWLEAAEISADAYLDIYSIPYGHQSLTRAQLDFVEEQDKPTGRADRMFERLRRKAVPTAQKDYRDYRNGIFLPQPTLPSASRISKNVFVPQHQTSRGPTSSWRLSMLADLSDSGGEEGISEADRDARLARTRTSTPVPAADDDDLTMSSGDESDNADLTDGSSADDWSDAAGSSKEGFTQSLLMFYSPLTRHYHASPTKSGRIFTIARDGISFLRRTTIGEDQKSASDRLPFPPLKTKDENTTVFRLKCKQSIGMTVTPLTVQVASLLEDDLKYIVTDTELMIDLLLADCISKVSADNKNGYTIIEFDIPRVDMQMLQHIAMSTDDSPNIFKAMDADRQPTNLDITAIIDTFISGIRFSGVFGSRPSAITASCRRLGMSLDTSIDKRYRTATSPDASIFNLAIGTSVLSLEHQVAHLKLGRAAVGLGHRGPELMAAASIALLSSVSNLSQILGKIVPQHELQRSLLFNILSTSDESAVIDPLSTIQPSYLVQSGVPHRLRTDISFRFLYHLQTQLRATHPKLAPIKPVPKLQDVEELVALTEARLSVLDQDIRTVDDLTCIDPRFFVGDASNTSIQRESKHNFTSLALHAVELKLTILAHTGTSSSEVLLKDLVLRVHCKRHGLVQFNFGHPSSASQTSLRAKSNKVVRSTMVTMTLGDLSLTVAPHLMHFAQQVIRVKRQYIAGLELRPTRKKTQDIPDRISTTVSGITQIELVGVIHRLRIQAAAENLLVVIGFEEMKVSSGFLSMQSKSYSTNNSFIFDQLYIQARSPTSPVKQTDKDILASISLTGGSGNIISRPESRSRTNSKIVFGLKGFQFNVPRSALRLYRFVEEWRQDYLPAWEETVNTLLSEYKAAPRKALSPTPSRQSSRQSPIQVHCQIEHFEISLQVMHGTWLSWEMSKSVAYLHNTSSVLSLSHSFGLQVGSMALNISSRPNLKDEVPRSRVRLALPRLSVAGKSSEYRIDMKILLEFIDLKVKPSHWDTLLSVQQKFGQDFNDLVALMQRTRQKSYSVTKKSPKQSMHLKYDAEVKMQGFRVGLEGLSSTVLLECQDIGGRFTSIEGWSFDLNLSDLALSLASRSGSRGNTAPVFSRSHRSAFVIVDFNLSGQKLRDEADKNVRLSVTKIHAVMQPSSIGEFGDFVDYLQAEMLEREEQRALELAAFKEKTQSILKTFDVNVGDIELEKASWMRDLIVGIDIRNIGMAFPLIHDEELHLPRNKSKELVVRAFLFSIQSINFATQRGENGHATMQHLAFQFVPRFRQSSPEDFAAHKHQTLNSLVYPEMRAQLRTNSLDSSRRVWIKADVSGFILDIDSTIPSYVFSLVDVYRQGKDRVERISTHVPQTPLSALPIVENPRPSTERPYTTIPTSHIYSQLTFLSGKVRIYSGTAVQQFRTRNPFLTHTREMSDEQVLDLGAEVFNLPVVSVWGEYRATPASQKLGQKHEHEPSLLMFNSTVFSSQNTLRPTLLPFLTEFVGQVETRMRKVSTVVPPPPPLLATPSGSGFLDRTREDSGSSMQICFSLRIDKSKLELTCQPDVNVVAGLHWENGGFVLNVSPGARKVSLSGSVGGLTVGLKHGFLSEDCVKLDARNLAFNVSFLKTEDDEGDSISSVSIVLDTEFLGGVRFSRLQDILCFKAVWLDRIPIFNSQSPIEHKTNQPDLDSPVSSSHGLFTVFLLRIRKIALDVDLGQSITRINLELNETAFKTKLTDDLSELQLSVAELAITANGNISGHIRVPDCIFQTIRRSERALRGERGERRMMELRLTSGALIANVESEHQRLLHYRAEPLEVEIFDDWSNIHSAPLDESKPLRLSFVITCPEVVAVVTVGTIPRLLSYTNKFKANLEAQQQGAARESQTFRVTRTPKPDNPLSAVAEAMLHEARSRFKESGFSYTVRQHMSLRLDQLRLIVFPRSMKDAEIAQFIGRDVQARLDGLVLSDAAATAKRDLHLSFASMVVSKYNQVGHPNPPPLNQEEASNGRAWLSALLKEATETNIFGLPSMSMHMISEEAVHDDTRTLTYDFFSEFLRREGMEAFEDIYITLNMSLYAWLTVLRKNLTREMDQVRATEDWRTNFNHAISPASVGPQRKKKPPEPLNLIDPPRSATLPSASNTGGLTPYAPASARVGWLEQTRSPPASARELMLSPPTTLAPPSSPALLFPSNSGKESVDDTPPISQAPPKRKAIEYRPRDRRIERLTMRQLGEATPDVMHPFFMKKAGFNLEDSLPQYVHEYATAPLEEILEVLMKLYSRQLLAGKQRATRVAGDEPDC